LALEFDELTCLTTSISVSRDYLDSFNKSGTIGLPVMVYIHGGGAQDGTGHVDGLHSNAPLTAYSASIEQPVVMVNIGYRLGWFGGLTCGDVIDEFIAEPTSPYGPFNLALQDQRHAFEWIRKFIGGFGGDPLRVTAFGESAGSMFLTQHICGSSTRLFDRAILQSGLIFGNVSLETKESEYEALLDRFGIDKHSVDRLNTLRDVDAHLLAQFPGCHMTPYTGPVPGCQIKESLFSRGSPTPHNHMALIDTCSWLGDLVVGDDFWEGQLFFHLLEKVSSEDFTAAVRSVFPEKEGQGLLDAYELPHPDPNRAATQMSLFLGDMIFSAPVEGLCKRLSLPRSDRVRRNVYRYTFCLSNPFPGSICSFVPGHHYVEILFVFLTLLDRYPTHRGEWAKRQAKETARRWISFANGKHPWEPIAMAGKGGDMSKSRIAICDDLAGWTTRSVREDEELSKGDPWGERRYDGWRAFVTAFDALAEDEEDKLNEARLRLLQYAYGNGAIKLPFP
jgi:carboxylesterase type B